MDKTIINARERPYSADINDAQSLIGRTFSNFMRYAHSTSFSPASALASASACYGLAMTATPGVQTYVTLSPGALMQLSQTLAPAPGALESPYRIGLSRTTMEIALPTPGSATWYLLEAQVSESTTSEQRDILNATTGVFESTLVTKRAEYSVTTQWLVGTVANIPIPSFGDWVMIGAVLVQPSGTVLDAMDAVDLRPLATLRSAPTRQGWSRSASVPVLRTDATPQSLVNRNIRLAVDNATTNQDGAGYGGGLDLSVSDANSSINPIDPTTAAVLDPATTVSASTWYYLYLCPWYDSAPLTTRQGASFSRGVLVLSATPPDAEGLFNSAVITPPQPFSNYSVPAYQAPCVGALRSNSANNGWFPMSGGNGQFVLRKSPSDMIAFLGGGTQAIPATLVPAHAKIVHWAVDVSFSGSPGAGSQIGIYLGETGGTAIDGGWARSKWSLDGKTACDPILLSVPGRSAEEINTVVIGAAGATIGTVTLQPVGYTT